MAGYRHSIRAVVQRTGLSAHLVRIWEKRYGVVQPERTPTNRRLYSDEQVERLALLRQLTQAGQSIGHVAQLPTEKLHRLAAASRAGETSSAPPTPSSFVEEAVAAIRALDSRALEQVLSRSETALGGFGMLRRVVAPLAQGIGELWREGTLTAAHEHFSSAVLRTYLAQTCRSYAIGGTEPVLVVATPTGQLHELGALLAGALASNLGWRVTYLGAGLPAPEIAGAARQNRARAVALSLIYPADDPRIEGELTRLRELLPADVELIAGGQAMPAYRVALDRIGAVQAEDLGQLPSILDRLRKPAAAAADRQP